MLEKQRLGINVEACRINFHSMFFKKKIGSEHNDLSED